MSRSVRDTALARYGHHASSCRRRCIHRVWFWLLQVCPSNTSSPNVGLTRFHSSSVRAQNQPFLWYFSDSFIQWISWFLSSKGNEYFCEVDEDFILDRFNLTGLNNEVANYTQALDLITDQLGMRSIMLRTILSNSYADDDIQDELRGSLDVQARLLYGLIHARWIVTARGLSKMVWNNSCLISISNSFSDRQIQTCGVWSMPASNVSTPAASPCRFDRYPIREICKALLWTLRRSLLAQVISTWIHWRSLLWHDLPASSFPCIPNVDPPKKRSNRHWR